MSAPVPVRRLTPDDDVEEFRSAVRDFLARHADTATVLREIQEERGWNPAVWRRMAEELGVAGLDVPEDLNGADAGFRPVAVVAEELGRSVARSPWFATAVLGVGVLLHADEAYGDAARRELLPGLASGQRTATLAWLEDPARVDTGAIEAAAENDSGGWRITGGKILVVDGAEADLLFVPAWTDEGLAVFVVEAGAAQVGRCAMRVMDPTRQLATVTFAGAPARMVSGPGTGEQLLARVCDRAVAALACEQTGGAEAALDTAVEHARNRIQFGRPIGTLQAVKHRLADMTAEVEGARSASSWAAAAVAEDSPEIPMAAATAALACGAAYRYVAGESIQVHGGISTLR